MSDYLIVETQSLFNGARVLSGLQLALEMADLNQKVNLWLMQDAVQLLQLIQQNELKRCLEHRNIRCFVDDFSLQHRGVIELPAGVEAAGMELFARQLLNKSTKPVWH